jgi:hypothetical protein
MTSSNLDTKLGQASGTPTARDDGIMQDSQLHSDVSPEPSVEQPTSPTEEQALESHEVIELQTFSERKAWIEEKIKVNLSSPIFPKTYFKSCAVFGANAPH